MKLLETRYKEMMDNFENIVTLELLYFNIGADIGRLNGELSNKYYDARKIRLELKKKEYKSIAAFNSDYKDTDEYISMKQYGYQIEGLARMCAGIKMRVESLRMELKGQY